MGYTQIGFTIVFAAFYFAAGEFDAKSGGRHNGVLWATLSVLVSVLVFTQLNGTIGMVLGFQLLLLAGITIGRVLLDKN